MVNHSSLILRRDIVGSLAKDWHRTQARHRALGWLAIELRVEVEATEVAEAKAGQLAQLPQDAVSVAAGEESPWVLIWQLALWLQV